ncbi:hypothetical protein GCM10009599_11330 [Luteococcus peritonei]
MEYGGVLNRRLSNEDIWIGVSDPLPLTKLGTMRVDADSGTTVTVSFVDGQIVTGALSVEIAVDDNHDVESSDPSRVRPS